MNRPLRARPQGLLALLAAFAVFFGTAIAVVPAAHAAGDVQIDNVRFSSDTVEDGTRASLYVDWSIPAKATNPGA